MYTLSYKKHKPKSKYTRKNIYNKKYKYKRRYKGGNFIDTYKQLNNIFNTQPINPSSQPFIQ
jgi:hypothetical protein